MALFFLFLIDIGIVAQDSIIVQDILNAENILDPINKNEIEVISASRSIKKIQDLPITIRVITREEILRNGYITLVDVLKTLPGIRVSQPGNCEIGESFGMRNFNGNQYTKILINNIPVKPSVVFGMPLEAQIPVRQAERIEVIYGPAAAIYGSDAVTGVVNIITKEASTGVFAEADVVLGQNKYDYINFHAGGKAGKDNKIFKYSFYGSQMNFGKMNIFNDTSVYKPLYYLDYYGAQISLGNTVYKPSQLTQSMLDQYGVSKYLLVNSNYDGSIDKPEIQNLACMSKMIGMEFKYKRFSLSYQYMYRQTPSSIGRNSFLYKYNDPSNYIGDKINVVNLVYNRDWERLRSTTNLSFLDYRQDDHSSFGVTFVDYSDKFYQFSMSEDFLFEEILTLSLKKLELVGGFTAQVSGVLPNTNYSLLPFQQEKFELFNTKAIYSDHYSELQERQDSVLGQFGFNPQSNARLSYFLQGYYEYKKFVLMGGFRWDNFIVTSGKDKEESRYNSLNPRLAILYKINNRFSVRASYGRAFKEPSASQKFSALAFLSGINYDSIYYAISPNPQLQPEIFNSFDLGVRKTLGNNFFVDATFFYSNISKLIVPTYVQPEDANLPLMTNLPDAFIRVHFNSLDARNEVIGSEVSLLATNLIESIKLNAEFGGSFLKVVQHLTEEEENTTKNLIPEYIVKMALNMQPGKRTYINLQGIWSSKREKFTQYNRLIVTDEENYINGFFTFDATFSFKFSKNLSGFIKMINITNESYGGMEATGFDADLKYNPQYGSNVRLGLTLAIN
jgi:hemoglobin/transferrin/lactoferrin receptor protein